MTSRMDLVMAGPNEPMTRPQISWLHQRTGCLLFKPATFEDHLFTQTHLPHRQHGLNENANSKAFWRAKYARQCTKRFQAQQLSPFLFTPPSVPTPGPGAPPPQQPPALPDRPPVHPIPTPIPILIEAHATPAPEDEGAAAEGAEEEGVTIAGAGAAPGAPPPPKLADLAPAAEDPTKLTIGIIGAGAAGLYTAMILQDLGLDYEILEGSDRVGGRILTHRFEPKDNKWNYFDIGAMRYPEIDIMWRVFDLFRNRLKIGDKLVDYIMTCPNQFLEYNKERIQQKVFENTPHTDDVFKDSTVNNGLVDKAFINLGVNHWLGQCFTPFKELLAKDWKQGWEKLMEFDRYSARMFMAEAFDIKNPDKTKFLKKQAYPDSAINWMERMNTGTGLFDMAFSEMVIDDLQFDWPNATAVKFGASTTKSEGDDTGEPKWFCLEGGSEVFIDAMVKSLKKPILKNKRVTAIVPTANEKPLQVTYGPGLHKASVDFDYVISTIPLPALRFVDLDRCNLSYAQLEGMRTLRYDSSCKVGIKFKSRWWQGLDSGSIKGGQSKTDRIIRTAVFPSYGVNDPKADAVMIASYTWSQDAARVGGLMHGRKSEAESFLIENIIEDLALLHGVTVKFLTGEIDDWCAWDWYADPFTLGAFALFGPGQFANIYSAFGQSAAGGRLIFAGEALSAQHAWVEGALDSAYVAVDKLLEGARLPKLREKLEAKWGNPHLREEELKEIKEIMFMQEIIGAVLSAFDNFEDIKLALSKFELNNDIFENLPKESPAIPGVA